MHTSLGTVVSSNPLAPSANTRHHHRHFAECYCNGTYTVTAATTITLSLETMHVYVRETEWKTHTQRHHLQLTGSKKDAGTSDGRWVESQEHIRPQTIIHEIPAKQRVRRTCNKTGGSGPSETPLSYTFNGTEKKKEKKHFETAKICDTAWEKYGCCKCNFTWSHKIYPQKSLLYLD